jgi:putative holliday junction resolvase
MPIITLENLHMPPGSRLLGLDLGTKTLGLALSDVRLVIATPMQTIIREKFMIDVRKMFEIAEKQGVGGFVLGLPLNMDGTDGPRAQSTRSFAQNLAPLTDKPIILQDERMSTQAVTKTLMAANASRVERKEAVDKMAAAFILQGALDRLNSMKVPLRKELYDGEFSDKQG